MRPLIVTALLFLASIGNAQTPEIISLSDSGAVDLAPRITEKYARNYVSWIRATSGFNGDIMFATKSAGDPGYSQPVRVTSTGKVNATLQRGPEFVIAQNGGIHLVWMEDVDIYYSRSTDAGKTWSIPSDISRDDHRATQDFPSIAADSAGNLYVIWVDNRDLIDGKSSNDHIYISRSLDEGISWDTPRRAEINPGGEGGSCECCRTAIAATGDGQVYFAYRSNINDRRDIFVARSNDGGTSFDTSIAMQSSPWHLMSCPATGPLITLDANESLHLVSRTGNSEGKTAIMYNVLHKGAEGPIGESLVTPISDGSNYPAIALSEGVIPVVAYQRSGRILYRSFQAGAWTQELPLYGMGKSQKFIWLASDQDGNAMAVWEDNVRDRGDILFRASIPITHASVETSSAHVGKTHSIVARGGDAVLLDVNGQQSIPWTLVDAAGREIAPLTTTSNASQHQLLIPNVSPGLYFLLGTDSRSAVKLLIIE